MYLYITRNLYVISRKKRKKKKRKKEVIINKQIMLFDLN